MNWIKYKDRKPTNCKGKYVIEFGWHPEVSIIIMAKWDGRNFYNSNWDTCQTIRYGEQVRNWFEIIEPEKDK